MYETLDQALDARRSDAVKELAKLFAKRTPTRKADRIALIVKALSGHGLRDVWDALDPLAQSAVAEVVHGIEDRLNVQQFVAKYGAMPKRHVSDYSGRSKSHPYTLLDVLLTGNAMAWDVKERLRAFVPPPAEARIETVAELPATVREAPPSWRAERGEKGKEHPQTVVETERAAQHDLNAVLRLVDAGKVSVSTTTRRVTLTGAKAVLGVLRDGDFLGATTVEKTGDSMRPFAWPLIVQSAGLAKPSGSKLDLTRAGRAALSKPAWEVIRACWQRWLKNTLLDEFNRIDTIKGQNRKGKGGLTAVAPRRAAVYEVLSLCPIGEWIEIDEFFRFAQASDNDFEVSRSSWSLYISDAHYGSLGHDGYRTWSMVQGRYVMCLLWEYAATMGLVDVAHVPAEWARTDFRDNWGVDDLLALSRYDGLKYFRVNALGAFCLGAADTYEPTPVAVRPALRVLTNHEIVVVGREGLEAGDALFLDKVSVKTGDRAWRLERAKMLAAIEEGIEPPEIREFLAAKNDGPLPANIVRFLEDVTNRASLISYEGTAEVFRVADEPTALLIAHDSTAGPLCLLAGTDRLIVPTDKVTAFRRALRDLGYAAQLNKNRA